MKAVNFPVIPARLNTVRCGNFKDRWIERRAILVAQRDIVLANYKLVETLQRHGVKHLYQPLVRHEEHIDTLNKRIDECNEMIEALNAA